MTDAYPHSELIDGVDTSILFTPTRIGGMSLRNRLAMAPMTRQFSPDGVPTADVAAYYGRRAASIGLIITEGTYVDHPSAGNSRRVPRLDGPEAVDGWRRVVDAVHEHGSSVLAQLWHLGARRYTQSRLHPGAPVVSPSGLSPDGSIVGEPMTDRQLSDVVDGFRASAALARAAGFDGVELHGAHGYLLDQFLWRRTNTRSDRYGGSLVARSGFVGELSDAVRAETGPDFCVVLRFSQWKGDDYGARIAENESELAEFLDIVGPHADALHVSTRRYWEPAFAPGGETLAALTRRLSGRPVITVGSVGIERQFRGTAQERRTSLSLGPLVRMLEAGDADVVAVGRALLADPDWAVKIRERRTADIRPYTKDTEEYLI